VPPRVAEEVPRPPTVPEPPHRHPRRRWQNRIPSLLWVKFYFSNLDLLASGRHAPSGVKSIHEARKTIDPRPAEFAY